MFNKNSSFSTFPDDNFVGNGKETVFKPYGLSKIDHDLYHDEDNKIEPIIRIKKITIPNDGEKWKITMDNKLYFTVEGNKLSKPERLFLQTPEGFSFLLNTAKTGIKSLNSLRLQIKEFLGNKNKKSKKKKK